MWIWARKTKVDRQPNEEDGCGDWVEHSKGQTTNQSVKDRMVELTDHQGVKKDRLCKGGSRPKRVVEKVIRALGRRGVMMVISAKLMAMMRSSVVEGSFTRSRRETDMNSHD
nr:hypothetical protein Iba_chr05eCG11250 [Ipomoea batatas]